MKVNATIARTHLLRLITLAQGGKDITITKGGAPIARLLPIAKTPVTAKTKNVKMIG
jgi:prevent-host-death family protein